MALVATRWWICIRGRDDVQSLSQLRLLAAATGHYFTRKFTKKVSWLCSFFSDFLFIEHKRAGLSNLQLRCLIYYLLSESPECWWVDCGLNSNIQQCWIECWDTHTTFRHRFLNRTLVDSRSNPHIRNVHLVDKGGMCGATCEASGRLIASAAAAPGPRCVSGIA